MNVAVGAHARARARPPAQRHWHVMAKKGFALATTGREGKRAKREGGREGEREEREREGERERERERERAHYDTQHKSDG